MFKYSEVVGDLFEVPTDYVLAHCVSVDCAMGKGIALEFVKRNPGVQGYCMSHNPKVGDAIIFPFGRHLFFNLFTKEKYWHKPTYQTLRTALENMRRQVVTIGANKIAIPLIGSGLDKLDWNVVREIVKDVFQVLNVEILVVRLK